MKWSPTGTGGGAGLRQFYDAREPDAIPASGTALNGRAIITFHGIFPKDNKKDKESYGTKLRQKVNNLGAAVKVLGYEECSGTLRFEVPGWGHGNAEGATSSESEPI